MRWGIKNKNTTPTVGVKGPELGDRKTFVRFAWLPKKVGPVHRVWLENYMEVWVYQEIYIRNDYAEMLGTRWTQADTNKSIFLKGKGWKLEETKLIDG
jgi:hypothetical protein